MTDELWLVKPIPDLPDDADEMQVCSFTFGLLHPSSRTQVACTEWVWGLKRGGLPYYLADTHNSLYGASHIGMRCQRC